MIGIGFTARQKWTTRALQKWTGGGGAISGGGLRRLAEAGACFGTCSRLEAGRPERFDSALGISEAWTVDPDGVALVPEP